MLVGNAVGCQAFMEHTRCIGWAKLLSWRCGIFLTTFCGDSLYDSRSFLSSVMLTK
jgi:hypothetical protein